MAERAGCRPWPQRAKRPILAPVSGLPATGAGRWARHGPRGPMGSVGSGLAPLGPARHLPGPTIGLRGASDGPFRPPGFWLLHPPWAGGETAPTAPWTPGVPGPAGRNGPSEAPRRPMVGPGRCQAAPTGPSRSPPALQVPGATSRPLRAPHDRPGGHMRPDLAAGHPARVAADLPCTCTLRPTHRPYVHPVALRRPGCPPGPLGWGLGA